MESRLTRLKDLDLQRFILNFFLTRPSLIRIIAALFVVLSASNSWAIDIAHHKWGFNGKVAPHRFNLLSVLINNPTPQQFTGEIRLQKSLGGAGTVDATIVETVTISPNTQKWVQFYPYIASDSSFGGQITEKWRVVYPGGNFDLSEPRIARYQRVILDDPNAVTAKDSAIKFRHPDNLFPPFVTATDALQVVLLDHIPRWEESRRQAFLDWLYLGGTAVVIHDASGKFPDFTGPMAVLKTPLDDQMYGSGRVIHFPRNRSQFSEEDFRQVCAGLPKNYHAPNTPQSDDYIDHVDESQQLSQAQSYAFNDASEIFRATTVLSELRQMTKPEHNWFLLHLLFWIYIALIFPGCYLLGRRFSDFRIVYAGLLGTVVVFSVLFSYVGQRGYGEATAVHTICVAKPLPDGEMDVSGWSNVFVTSGADYDIRYNAKGSLFSTCSETEQVKGVVNNGSEGMFRVDIPPFSDREIATRTKSPMPDFSMKLDTAKSSDGRLAELEIQVQGVKESDVERQFVLIGNTFYNLAWKDGKLVLDKDMGTVSSVVHIQEIRNNRFGYNSRFGYEQQKVTTNERYRQLFDVLLVRGMNISRERDAEQLRLPPGLVRVFMYAKIPRDFAIQHERLGNQQGRVLYCVTLSATDSSKAAPDKPKQ